MPANYTHTHTHSKESNTIFVTCYYSAHFFTEKLNPLKKDFNYQASRQFSISTNILKYNLPVEYNIVLQHTVLFYFYVYNIPVFIIIFN